MDRRIALFVFGVLVLFACDDSNGYDPCASNGCEKKERTASWRTEQVVAGTVAANGKTFRDGEIRATRTGFVVERYETAPRDAGAEDADAHADAGETDAETDADADAPREEQLHSYDGHSGSTYRLVVSFRTPDAPGVYRLEDVGAVATFEATAIDLTGTLEVLDVQSENVSGPGAPTTPPYEMPFGWVMKSTNPGVAVDARVESRATWRDSYGYSSCY